MIMEITTRNAGEVLVVDINGEICRSEATNATLHECVKDQLERGRRNIILNLANVAFIDSFGVGEILASYTSTQNLGGKMKLAHISKKLDLVFKVTWLDHVLEIFETEAAALKSFSDR